MILQSTRGEGFPGLYRTRVAVIKTNKYCLMCTYWRTLNHVAVGDGS